MLKSHPVLPDDITLLSFTENYVCRQYMSSISARVVTELLQDLICFQNGADGVRVPPAAWEPCSETGADTGLVISCEPVQCEMTREYKQKGNNTNEHGFSLPVAQLLPICCKCHVEREECVILRS